MALKLDYIENSRSAGLHSKSLSHRKKREKEKSRGGWRDWEGSSADKAATVQVYGLEFGPPELT